MPGVSERTERRVPGRCGIYEAATAGPGQKRAAEPAGLWPVLAEDRRHAGTRRSAEPV